jgi:hypothetical protein
LVAIQIVAIRQRRKTKKSRFDAVVIFCFRYWRFPFVQCLLNFFDNADRFILDIDPFYANQIQIKGFDLVTIAETLPDRLSALRTRRETDLLADGLLTLILSIHPLVHFFQFDPVVAFQINIPGH